MLHHPIKKKKKRIVISDCSKAYVKQIKSVHPALILMHSGPALCQVLCCEFPRQAHRTFLSLAEFSLRIRDNCCIIETMATIVKDPTLLKRGFIDFYYDFVVSPMSLKSLAAEEKMALPIA